MGPQIVPPNICLKPPLSGGMCVSKANTNIDVSLLESRCDNSLERPFASGLISNMYSVLQGLKAANGCPQGGKRAVSLSDHSRGTSE